MNIIELFAGIGSQKKALVDLKIKHKVLNIAEWYIPAILAYDSIHHGKRDLDSIDDVSLMEMKEYLGKFTFSMNSKKPMSKNAFENMNINLVKHLYIANRRTNNLVSIDKVHGSELSGNIDVMTYSFPCQDLSNVGAFHGYNNGIDKGIKSRSGLLWEVERILKERVKSDLELPKILLMENVSTLLSPRHNKNFQLWIDSLEGLGYINKYYVINAKDYGIPQNRKRIFMISVKSDDLSNSKSGKIKKLLEKDFNHILDMPSIDEFLRLDYQGKFLKEANEAQPGNTISRKHIYENNYYLYGNKRERMNYCRTITTRQDRHPNAGVIEYKTKKNNYRFITARESFLLMGFKDKDFDAIENDNFYRNRSQKFFSRDKYYVLAGNSIVVNVLRVIFKRIEKINNVLKGE